MWTFRQTSGVIDENGAIEGVGYSGSSEGKNNPFMQNVPCVGPIPQGRYAIGDPFDSPTHGPHAMRLTPDPANEMFGRSGFLIHGDSISHPGNASEGCIVLPRNVRDRISASGDNVLEVVA